MSDSVQELFPLEIIAQHTKQTLAEMWNYAKEGISCDVTLVAALDGKKVTAHRMVLSAANKFFRAMFNGCFKEAKEKEVTVSQISGDILELLVEYCYNGTININEDNVQLLLSHASLMLFPNIVEACSIFLKPLVNFENCLSMAKCAKLYNCQTLLENAEKHMKQQFLKVVMSEEFLKLSQDDLEVYLSFQELNVDSEMDILQAVMRWINQDSENRCCVLSKLLPLIQLHLIENNHLLEYVNTYRNEHYYSSLLEGVKQNLYISQSMPAKTVLKPNRIVVVCNEKIQIYNPISNVVEYSFSIPVFSSYARFTPTLFGEKVFLLGQGKMFSFDMNRNTWHDLTNKDFGPYYGNVEVLNECIYLIGERVARWDSKLKEWSILPSMNEERNDHCTAVLNGEIYAISGFDDDTGHLVDSSECYNPNTNDWSFCSTTRDQRLHARAISANGKIYVFGGADEYRDLKTIEEYNPELGYWIPVSKMCAKRDNMGVYFFNNKIYLLGGYNESKWLKSMEEFDPVTKRCKLIRPPNIECKGNFYCFPYLPKNK